MLSARQFLAGRHFQSAILLDRGENQAVRGIARRDGRPALASHQQAIAAGEFQAVRLHGRPVASGALLLQERAHVFDENGTGFVDRLRGQR